MARASSGAVPRPQPGSTLGRARHPRHDRRRPHPRPRGLRALRHRDRAVVGLAQTLLDLTVEESLTKFGFRYVAAGGLGEAAPPLPAGARAQARRRRARDARHPRARAVRGHALRDRRARGADGRRGGAPAPRRRPRTSRRARSCSAAATTSAALLLSVTMGLRLVAIVVGASIGVTAALGALAVGQLLATAIVGTAGAVGPPPVPAGGRRARSGATVARSSRSSSSRASRRAWSRSARR